MRPDTDCAKKKAAIHERKILTDRQLFSLKSLCLRCGQNFIIDQLIGLIKGFDHLGRFRMEIDLIQRFGFGRVPDSAFQDILVDACAVTKAGVGMAGGVGRIGGKLPGKLRFALTIFVIRIRLDADFLQERIELAITPVLLIPETAFSIGKEWTVFHRGGIRMFKNRNAKVENGNDAVASGFGLAAADQISTGFRAVKIFVFEVQQLIDTHSTGQKSNYHIFVIATTNDTRYMPQSLLRPGRFDYILNLNPPLGKTAEDIVSYYLCDKNLAKDVQISDIVKAMPQVSCATLETVMNLAAINSVYRDHAHVQKEDIIDALLKVVYNLRKTDCEEDPQEHQMIAVHEAAHAVVGEVLHSGSIGIITIRGSHGAIGGMESGFAVYAKSEEEFQDEIIKTLAGKAGTVLIYGIMDIRAAADIKKADQLLDIWLCHFAGGGFSGVEPSENRLSEPRLSYNEAIKSAKLEELYRRAYKILYDNRDFLLAVQKELLEHETLLNSDLAKIRESCT